MRRIRLCELRMTTPYLGTRLGTAADHLRTTYCMQVTRANIETLAMTVTLRRKHGRPPEGGLDG